MRHVEDILKEVAKVFGTTPADIISQDRKMDVHAARVAVCYLADKRGLNRRQVAMTIKRDHSSVTQALGKARKLLSAEPFWADKVLKVEDRLVDIEEEPPFFIRSKSRQETVDLAGLEKAILELLEGGRKMFVSEVFSGLNTNLPMSVIKRKIQTLHRNETIGRTLIKGKYAYHHPKPQRPKRNDVRLHNFDGADVSLPVEPWLANNAVSV